MRRTAVEDKGGERERGRHSEPRNVKTECPWPIHPADRHLKIKVMQHNVMYAASSEAPSTRVIWVGSNGAKTCGQKLRRKTVH